MRILKYQCGMILPTRLLLQLALLGSLSSSQQTTQPQLSSSLPPPPPLQPLPVQPQQGAAPLETTTASISTVANSTVGTNTTLANSTENEVPTCFYQHASACANTTERKPCHALPSSPGSVLCCNIESNSALEKGMKTANIALKDIERLHLRNVTVKKLDVGVEPWIELVSLQHLAITDGAVESLQNRLRFPDLNCLNLSANAFTQLPSLDVHVERFWIDISGNNGLPCVVIRDFMSLFRNTSSVENKTSELLFARSDDTYCFSPQSFHWFNTTERVALAQVQALHSLDEDCPSFSTGACRCEPAMIDMVAGRMPTFSVKVDCSSCGLTELPERLPPHTIILNVSNNHIWNLTALSLNPHYSEVRRFLADNNTISSIDILEGSHFIQNFVELSLRSNNISAVPIYILSNGFDRSSAAQTVNLGENRLICDCSTAQTVKIWLINHKKNILDFHEVMCANMPERVVELDQNKICAVQSDWTDYIYYIIAGEVALLLLLIAKVSYDYWVFKTAGYLPWPASKMPKLPCDWVFE